MLQIEINTAEHIAHKLLESERQVNAIMYKDGKQIHSFSMTPKGTLFIFTQMEDGTEHNTIIDPSEPKL